MSGLTCALLLLSELAKMSFTDFDCLDVAKRFVFFCRGGGKPRKTKDCGIPKPWVGLEAPPPLKVSKGTSSPSNGIVHGCHNEDVRIYVPP